jgi:hypothetical protein
MEIVMRQTLVFFIALMGLGVILDGCVTVERPLELGQAEQVDVPG